jgi:hypothetical protein
MPACALPRGSFEDRRLDALDPIDAGQAVPVEVCLAAGDWGWAPFAERESPETSRPDLSCPDLHQRHVSSGSRTEAGWAQLFDRLRQPPTIRVLPFPSSSAVCLMPTRKPSPVARECKHSSRLELVVDVDARAISPRRMIPA